MVVLNDRELLIKFNGKHVLRCDIDGKFLGIVNLGTCQYQISLTQHRFQESIVPVPYQEMQEEDAVFVLHRAVLLLLLLFRLRACLL
jgi:hypothetical protein